MLNKIVNRSFKFFMIMEMYIAREDGMPIVVTVDAFVNDIIDQIAECSDVEVDIRNKDIISYAKKYIEENEGNAYTRNEYYSVLEEARQILELYSQLTPYTFFHQYFSKVKA